ncbi:hypothetical protein [Variovorax arabinosiphilus]|uniref:hypothetical protein n=1 Tax=Variovorax arabinosiphilus TaxID=3053498 RepID=UPI0025771D95|nr:MULTISPECIES: hypothetical protein [unclassified Variovorax]MDM0118435.1 hypothetical protein [Variovorax sp. J2L1-78]MDM0128860.1 hypothetical protein [Variovorax sp. J2L1-63]MDM0233354.1 hypothetical protein [Variovorax sp. J2R1-6]
MGNVTEFLWTVIASSAGTTALLAALAFLLKGQISHWLSKDLEAQKAQYQLDLEAYRVSLIAATERSKAGQEVKKTGALRVLEMKFEAYSTLHKATLGLYADVITQAVDMDDKTAERFEEIHARSRALRDAIYSVSVFIDTSQRRLLTNYSGLVTQALQFCVPGRPALEDGGVLDNELLAAEIEVDGMVRGLVEQMQSLD